MLTIVTSLIHSNRNLILLFFIEKFNIPSKKMHSSQVVHVCSRDSKFYNSNMYNVTDKLQTAKQYDIYNNF
jgi:hypothetical protein